MALPFKFLGCFKKKKEESESVVTGLREKLKFSTFQSKQYLLVGNSKHL